MAIYKKKPVEVEAFQYNVYMRDDAGKTLFPKWFLEAYRKGTCYYAYDECKDDISGLYIKTLEGDHHVSYGDYIIKGVAGELYPCKPDIFKATYELAENEAN